MYGMRGPVHAAFLFALFSMLAGVSAQVQSGNSTSVGGTVLDPSGAAVVARRLKFRIRSASFNEPPLQTRREDSPFNPYHLSAKRTGFAPYTKDVEVRSAVPVNLDVKLQLESAASTITVEGSGGDLVERDPTFHTDVDRSLFDKLPLRRDGRGLVIG